MAVRLGLRQFTAACLAYLQLTWTGKRWGSGAVQRCRQER